MGRVSSYTEEIAEQICERLGNGEPLTWICRDEGMPTDRTVRNWMEANADFASAIARARARGFDAIAEGCLEIADDAKNDWMERNGGEDAPGWTANGEHIQRSKLRIETRLKLLAKWDPKRYGEKLALEHSGEISIADRLRAARERKKGGE